MSQTKLPWSPVESTHYGRPYTEIHNSMEGIEVVERSTDLPERVVGVIARFRGGNQFWGVHLGALSVNDIEWAGRPWFGSLQAAVAYITGYTKEQARTLDEVVTTQQRLERSQERVVEVIVTAVGVIPKTHIAAALGITPQALNSRLRSAAYRAAMP